MSLRDNLEKDLDVWFNVDEFARRVRFYVGTSSTEVAVQFFDEESDLGDSMMRKLIVKKSDLQNISKDGYFLIDGVRYGVVDYIPDEENLIYNVLLQKGMN